MANAYVVDGADDTGAALLQQVQARVAAGDTATLYLLYPPDPASPNASGLASDVLDPNGTYLLKTNLSTLTHSGSDQFGMLLAAPDPTQVYAATLADPADFLAVLWEASITRSGGFYLNYVNANGGVGLPADGVRQLVHRPAVAAGAAAVADRPLGDPARPRHPAGERGQHRRHRGRARPDGGPAGQHHRCR